MTQLNAVTCCMQGFHCSIVVLCFPGEMVVAARQVDMPAHHLMRVGKTFLVQFVSISPCGKQSFYVVLFLVVSISPLFRRVRTLLESAHGILSALACEGLASKVECIQDFSYLQALFFGKPGCTQNKFCKQHSFHSRGSL